MNQKNNKYYSLYKLPSVLVKAVYNLSSKKVKLVKLKNWQLDAHLTLRDASLGFIVAPCGAGKTILMRSIGAYKTFLTNKRSVFVVPKNDIGRDGFASYLDIEMPLDGRNITLHLSSPHNLCHEKAESKIDELIDLLLKDPLVDDSSKPNYIGKFHQIVCTHQSLTLAIRKIQHDPKKLKRFLLNNVFWIDEGHHIKGKETYNSQEDLQAMNLLGEFVNLLLENRNETGAQLFPVTATPFRSNGTMFSYEQLRGFVPYELDRLEHFKTLGIEQIGMGLEEYDGIEDLVKRVVHNISLELEHYHIVFVPPTGRKWRKEKQDYKILFNAIYKMLVLKLGADVANDVIIDLVEENIQNYNDELLRLEPKSGDTHKPKIRIVIACMKCREGSDWCPADRIHNTSMEESPTLIAQTNGRLHRFFPGKDNIKIQYYAEKFKPLNHDNKREFVSDRVNCILYFMIADDLFNPIILDIPSYASENEKDKTNPVKKNKPTLEKIFSINYQPMISDLLNNIAEVDFNEKAVDQVISLMIEKHLPNRDSFSKTEIEEIQMGLKAFLLRARSSKLRSMKVVDVSFIRKRGFDKVVEQNNLHGNMFVCDLNKEDLERFNELVKKRLNL